MKCPKCGKEFNGKFCPECGARAEATALNQAAQALGETGSPVPPQKKGGCLKIGLIVLGVLVVLAALGGIFGGSKSPSSSSKTASPAASAPAAPAESVPAGSASESAPAAPAYEEVTAEDLLAAYEDNEISADNSYKGKLLRVTGIVGDIGKDVLDQAYVTLGDGSAYSLYKVQCYFDKENLEDIAQLHAGDTITIEGVRDGKSLNVVLKKCDVVA